MKSIIFFKLFIKHYCIFIFYFFYEYIQFFINIFTINKIKGVRF